MAPVRLASSVHWVVSGGARALRARSATIAIGGFLVAAAALALGQRHATPLGAHLAGIAVGVAFVLALGIRVVAYRRVEIDARGLVVGGLFRRRIAVPAPIRAVVEGDDVVVESGGETLVLGIEGRDGAAERARRALVAALAETSRSAARDTSW